MSKGSLADRDLDLSYGARKVWFWHQICQYYTVCHHVEAYNPGRLSIDGFSFERVAQSNLEWIFGRLDSGFQSLVGFRIPKPRIPDSTSKKFLDSGIRIPLHGAKHTKVDKAACTKMRLTLSYLHFVSSLTLVYAAFFPCLIFLIPFEHLSPPGDNSR